MKGDAWEEQRITKVVTLQLVPKADVFDLFVPTNMEVDWEILEPGTRELRLKVGQAVSLVHEGQYRLVRGEVKLEFQAVDEPEMD